jgi:hypothetical protein
MLPDIYRIVRTGDQGGIFGTDGTQETARLGPTHDHLAEIECWLAGRPGPTSGTGGWSRPTPTSPGSPSREVVHHVSHVTAYAQMMGRLA